ncbi:uncharacterized protein LOC111362860 [Spodoptera litura]|uniref:Uncharacterized protein LOC111362860 n=1 Tax=Spodoptera litura TaxID=69820 RepID=A0A9J7EPH9_SPOLT|nr:uncharacterized protein LOC111362860 [Spodoptera litura]
MKRKALSILLATLLVSNALPITSFADQLPAEGVEVPKETTESSSEEVETEESTTESTEESTADSSEKPTTPEPVEPPEITVPSEAAPEETAEIPTQEISQPAEENTATVIEVPAEGIRFERNETTETFIAKIGEEARTVGQEKDLYASVMIAQAILESGSGSSQLSQEPNFNLFGIKGDYEGQFVVYGTWEDDGQGNSYNTDAAFRVYPSYKESFEDYSELLTDGLTGDTTFYSGTWKSMTETYQDATEFLTGRYATDTLYNQKLDSLIETYNLTQYDHEKETIIAGGDFEPFDNVNHDSGNSYAAGNCTQFVYNRIIQLGGYVDLDMGNGADWGATGRVRGYEVSNTPKAGTAVSFAPGVLGADPDYGHVGFVERVNEDGSILISEMNAVGLGIISTRTIPAGFGSMLTYVTPK